jgi:peptidoglycan hydrolase-like protein with peptidoglycan-binding domain
MTPDRDLLFRLPLLSGEDVRQAQLALHGLGLLEGEPDGVFGPATGAAVRRFQAQRGMAADGVLRRALWPTLVPEAAPSPAAASARLAPLAARLAGLHGPPVGPGTRRWHLTAAGVVFAGDAAAARTAGAPTTAGTCWQRFAPAFAAAASRFGVPVELLLACACTESHGRPDAIRQEPGYISDQATPERVSPGLMQTLIATARDVLADPTLDRARLLDPAVSIAAGAALMRRQALSGRTPTGFDPPLVGIAYNAGSLRPASDPGNPWGLVQTRAGEGWYADVFSAFLGDALAVLAEAAPPSGTPNLRAMLTA